MIHHDPVFEAHRQLGFPTLPPATQAYILLSSDYTPIQDLVPDLCFPFPSDLLRHYITISRQEFAEYLQQSDYIERNQETYLENPHRDGMWIRNTNDGFEIIWQERGYIDEVEMYADLDALYQRLIELIYEPYGNK